MKKIYQSARLSFGMVLLACIFAATADARNLEQARQAALQQMKKNTAMKAPGKGNATAVNPQLVFLKTKNVGDAYYYVFSAGKNQGFTMVSGDDRLPAIVGYTESGDFNADSMPDGLAYFMEAYREFVDNATEAQVSAVMARASHKAVAPFMQEKWNQDAPYNGKCPVSDDGNLCYAGCVATAMAQILHYWYLKTPASPTSLKEEIPAYKSEIRVNGKLIGFDMPAIPAGYEYDWANMTNTYGNSSTQAQKDAVATLMLHVGCAVQMKYTPYMSGASSSATAFTKYFGMDEDYAQKLNRDNYELSEWDNMLYAEIAAGRPVLYSGQSSGGGHAFVIHGYEDGLYYVNWGWGGYQDGYFDITVLDPEKGGIGAGSSSDGYNKLCDMVVGVQPDNGNKDNVALSQLTMLSFKLPDLAVSKGNVTATAKIEILNFNVMPLSKYVSVGYTDANGKVVNVGTGQKIDFPAALEDGSAIYNLVNCTVNFTAPNGTYKLYVIESADNNVWAASNRYFDGIKYSADKYVSVTINDGADGISDAVNDTNSDGIIYNLRGEKVTAPGKGIYIRNGKKFVIR